LAGNLHPGLARVVHSIFQDLIDGFRGAVLRQGEREREKEGKGWEEKAKGGKGESGEGRGQGGRRKWIRKAFSSDFRPFPLREIRDDARYIDFSSFDLSVVEEHL